ncbi:hypothetical protein [Nocardioides pantholopis]|uniref:hypothetical protein n=1 Tax=Nocardioides pantholopis TaxID=2483798 RepID=UPI000F08D9D9|nr:hypothetical protein [Nocardioides pantholopis]
MRPRWWPVLAWCVLVAVLAGCVLLARDADRGRSERALLAQRDQVDAELRELLAGVGTHLGQEVRTDSGLWLGCSMVLESGFRAARYTANIRLDVRTPRARVAPELVRIAREAGWVVEPGPRRRADAEEPKRAEWVRGRKSDLAADLADLAPGVEGHVLLRVTADTCLDVPSGQRETWILREEPGPLAD